MRRSLLLALLLLTALPNGARATRIVLAADDWVLTNTGFSNLPVDTTNFALNLAQFLTGGSGAIHAYSTDQWITGSNLNTTLTNAGYTFTTGTSITFDLPTLLTFDAILFGIPLLDAAQIDVLTQYANSGGGVYVHAGLGASDPSLMPNAWNPFLTQFGLELGSNISGLSGNISLVSSHPLFTGVSALYHVNPHDITGCCVVATTTTGTPLFAAVPEPATGALLACGLFALALKRRSVLRFA